MNSQAMIFFEQEVGLSPQRATLLFSLIYWLSFAGKFLFGALSDRMTKRRVLLLTSIVLLAGCTLLFDFSGDELNLTRNIPQLTVFAIVFGLGFGGSFTMIQLVTVESFGQRALGKILGIVILIDGIGGMLGITVTSQIRTATGNYLESFLTVVVVAVIAVIGVSLIKPVMGKPADGVTKSSVPPQSAEF